MCGTCHSTGQWAVCAVVEEEVVIKSIFEQLVLEFRRLGEEMWRKIFLLHRLTWAKALRW